MNAQQIAEYVKVNGKQTQHVEDTGDAENGPDCSCFNYTRLGRLVYYASKQGEVCLVQRPDNPEGDLIILDTMPNFAF